MLSRWRIAWIGSSVGWLVGCLVVRLLEVLCLLGLRLVGSGLLMLLPHRRRPLCSDRRKLHGSHRVSCRLHSQCHSLLVRALRVRVRVSVVRVNLPLRVLRVRALRVSLPLSVVQLRGPRQLRPVRLLLRILLRALLLRVLRLLGRLLRLLQLVVIPWRVCATPGRRCLSG